MRTYSVKAVALTLVVQLKWLDNLLSRHQLPGVARSRQGIERRISDEGLLAIEACRILNLELGVPLERAASIVRSGMEGRVRDEIVVATPTGLTLRLSLDVMQRRLRDRITDAVEAAGRTRRGRPPASGPDAGY